MCDIKHLQDVANNPTVAVWSDLYIIEKGFDHTQSEGGY